MDNAKKVLLVEDEPIIAMDMEMSLSDKGWHVIGPAATAVQALDLIEKNLPDVAILDFNIRGGTSEDIAVALLERSVPVVFLSGDSKASTIDSLKHCRVLAKPAAIETIASVLSEAVGTD